MLKEDMLRNRRYTDHSLIHSFSHSFNTYLPSVNSVVSMVLKAQMQMKKEEDSMCQYLLLFKFKVHVQPKRYTNISLRT